MITGSAIIVTLFFGGWHLPLPSWHGGFHWALINGDAPGWRGVIGGLFNIATFFGKVTRSALFLHLGALDPAAISLRSTHAPGLAFLF